MYTIGEVAEMFGLKTSTIRYYDSEGFFPNIVRKGNIRYFNEEEIETIRIIMCLKKTDLEIKEISEFLSWLKEGNSSFEKRKQLFENRKTYIENQISDLKKTLSLLEYKCWYYENAIKDGNEERVRAMLPNKLPAEIQTLYDDYYKLNN